MILQSNKEALLAGFWASIGSSIGKLSGSNVVSNYVVKAGLLIVMVLVNTWGCRYYLRSLDGATNTVAPTVISAASSYIIAGAIGIGVFDESASVRWWTGAMLIVVGLGLVVRPRSKRDQ